MSSGMRSTAGTKLLLFSQFTVLDALTAHFKEEEAVLSPDQTTPKEGGNDQAFRRDYQGPRFLVPESRRGTGINLTAADIVIHLTPGGTARWKTRRHRRPRIGQKTALRVNKADSCRIPSSKGILEPGAEERPCKIEILSGETISRHRFREETAEVAASGYPVEKRDSPALSP